jgi:hypothetical protein
MKKRLLLHGYQRCVYALTLYEGDATGEWQLILAVSCKMVGLDDDFTKGEVAVLSHVQRCIGFGSTLANN